LSPLDIATGKQLWMVPLEWDPAVARIVCCGLSNRGVALYNGKVYVASLDAQVRALDAATGKEVWKVKIAEWKEGYSVTSAPTIANGVLMTGMTGGEYGVRGFVDGYDPETGKHLWRRHTTAGPGEKGSDTWPKGDAYLRGGGSTWITGSYDPELDLVYWGTSNGGPWTAVARPGDNLWISSVIAFRPKTGEIVWGYQWTPADTYDFDGNNENVLADITVGGVKRKALLHADRNGFLYALDRTNGKLIAANLTCASTGPSASTRRARARSRPTWRSACAPARKSRSGRGGRRQELDAHGVQPGDRRLYFAMLDEASVYQLNKELPVYKAGERYMGVEEHHRAAQGWRALGLLRRAGPAHREAEMESAAGRAAQLVRDVGHRRGHCVLRQGERRIRRARRGLGRHPVAVQDRLGINAQPITYTYKGRQYVTVLSGLGGGTSSKRETEGKVLPGGSV